MKVIFVFLLGLIFAILTLLFIHSSVTYGAATCALDQRIPKIEAAFWAADSKSGAIVRAEDKKAIACLEPEFDQYTCLTYYDLKKIYATLLKCKKWSTQEIDQAILNIFVERISISKGNKNKSDPIDKKESNVREKSVSLVDWKDML